MDEKDRKIISILQQNGKATLSQIAEKMGMSAMGVKKRLDKLEKGKIKLTPLLNVEELGIITAVVAMEVESSDALRKIIEKFRDCPRIIKFFVTTGSYNLFALIYAEDYHSLESITLEKCSLRSQPGIRRYDIFPIQEIFYDSYLDIKVVAEKEREDAPCGVFCGDCYRYESNRCLGCPATKFYRGRL
ncbi:Lrp/AsnC family transcriptional regulator [Archaeoglobus fulgidus]|jgi:DNA-binding Lrp family transcriptional regulator|uniref:Transcriptional regulatory protein, AsnC family n=3 Tax=Archaeoglobus fulgidus TaxID=2234 RepID=O28824_ARCFU|nr:Lrp/AsnC family transcriptional regulator [Archaeoglobus fulgidus]AAB89801.1 transcriptional regulatory protein, AsnC family [Archaeoglobus fulgidus DSM 4304]AIG98328.1 Transcriptional regulator [Archaeoglobus fulgidus DSM 8774]